MNFLLRAAKIQADLLEASTPGQWKGAAHVEDHLNAVKEPSSMNEVSPRIYITKGSLITLQSVTVR